MTSPNQPTQPPFPHKHTKSENLSVSQVDSSFFDVDKLLHRILVSVNPLGDSYYVILSVERDPELPFEQERYKLNCYSLKQNKFGHALFYKSEIKRLLMGSKVFPFYTYYLLKE